MASPARASTARARAVVVAVVVAALLAAAAVALGSTSPAAVPSDAAAGTEVEPGTRPGPGSSDGSPIAAAGGDVVSASTGTEPRATDPDALEAEQAAYRSLQRCVPPQTEPPHANCIAELLVEATDEHGMRAASDAIARIISEFGEVEWMCHPAAHASGSLAFTKNGNAAETMKNLNTTCGAGFLHGVLDGFGKSKPPLEDYVTLGEACYWEGIAAQPGLCFDGIGHAVWNGTTDVDASARVCASMPEPGARDACTEGVLMQMYDPANEEATFPLEDAPEDLPGICANWPDYRPAGADESRTEFCYGGTAYLLMLPVTNDHFRRGEKVADNVDYYKARIAELGEQCAAMGPDGVKLCTETLGRHLAGPLVDHDFETASALCSVLGEYADGCRNQARKAIDGRADFRADGSLRAAAEDDTDAAGSGLAP